MSDAAMFKHAPGYSNTAIGDGGISAKTVRACVANLHAAHVF